jgi:hypothetical protein
MKSKCAKEVHRKRTCFGGRHLPSVIWSFGF